MTRAEMLDRISAKELAAWAVLFRVQGEELRRDRDIAESGDGIVHTYGRTDDDGDAS